LLEAAAEDAWAEGQNVVQAGKEEVFGLDKLGEFAFLEGRLLGRKRDRFFEHEGDSDECTHDVNAEQGPDEFWNPLRDFSGEGLV